METINCITYYYISDICIECRIYGDNISIIDSYQVKNDEDKKYIIMNLLESFRWFNETRTLKDMLDEWRVHNFCCSINFKRERTSTTDLELKQNIFKRFLYWLISKLIKKDV